ncbi:hypothetical protein ELS19_01125 [Halogeometricum borinquense]|uniref:Uncharacterized protein n=1 Tax=Halogeometricum borinquense TaxID=60847 RepID=A0A482T7W1_9EURY|nr:hypothetical protein [Halogeometricum borinquense]RYJ12712.1 hypothetical protein ELS19_01125 [Halogeometricum borinquense]
MEFGTGHTGMNGPSKSDRDIQTLMRCILNHFSCVSVKRLHNLSFLSEYEYYEKQDERLTSARYWKYLEGVHSEEIDGNLEDIAGIERRRTRINREMIPTLKIKDELECGFNKDTQQIISDVVERYGEIPPAEIQRKIADTDPYEDADSGKAIEFSP